MNVREAAILVLEESDTPLHANEITKRIILSRGLWKTSGQTPTATVRGVISSDIKKNGDASRFVRHAPLNLRTKENRFSR